MLSHTCVAQQLFFRNQFVEQKFMLGVHNRLSRPLEKVFITLAQL